MSENINHKLVVCGDIHLQSSEPKHSNAIDTLNWIFNNKDLNNPMNSIIFLGDLCEVNSSFSCFEKFVDYFVNYSRFNQIYLLTGNHDVAHLDNVLALFRPLKNVKVITDWEIIKFYNCNLLMLPHYSHEGTEKLSMIENYSNLYKTITEEFDYGFSHVEDETQHFSKKFVDVSKLNVKQWLNGHIHNGNAWNGGHYLGGACANSVAERGIDKKIAIVNGETKECEFVTLPKYLEYYTVEYPNPLPKIETKYAIFTIKNALDKQTVLSEYNKQAEELGFTFYTNKVLKQKVAEIEMNDLEICSEKPNFEAFAKAVGLSNEVFDICNEVIRLKGEE